MKVLCICPIGIGNYLMIYPACAAIKKHRPDVKLHLLGLRRAIADIASGDTVWDGIHLFDPSVQTNPLDKILFIKKLASERFDVSLSYFPSNRWEYNLLPFLSLIPRRFAFRYPLKRVTSMSFLANRLLDVDITLHDTYQSLALTEFFLNEKVKDIPQFPRLVSDELRREVYSDFLCHRKRKRFIAIHPGSSAENGMDVKRWAPDRFGALADKICSYLDAEALIVGGNDELPLKEKVKNIMQEPSFIVPPVNLQKTSALMSFCSLCLCNDSGIMHLAACSGTPVAAVFGPTDEKRNGPVGQGHIIIRKSMNGFPVWTAANVGDRSVKFGLDPSLPLKELSINDAWGQIQQWLTDLKSKLGRE